MSCKQNGLKGCSFHLFTHAQLIFTLGSWLHQGCYRRKAGDGSAAESLGIGGAWVGEGRKGRRLSHCGCGPCKSWGATAAALHFSYQHCSICSASSLPSIYRTGLSELQPGQESFLSSANCPLREQLLADQGSVSSPWWDQLSVSCLVVVARWGLAIPSRQDRWVTHATHAARELGLAMRSLDSVFEDTLGKHVSPSKKVCWAIVFPHLFPRCRCWVTGLQTWLASAGKWELPQQPGSRVRNSCVCWGWSAYSTLELDLIAPCPLLHMECWWLGWKHPWSLEAMLLLPSSLPPTLLQWEGGSQYISFGGFCALSLMLVMVHLMCFSRALAPPPRHWESKCCRERRGDAWCTSGQGQRQRGWIALFDNTGQEVRKSNHSIVQTCCMSCCSTPLGLGRARSQPGTHLALALALPTVYYTRC